MPGIAAPSSSASGIGVQPGGVVGGAYRSGSQPVPVVVMGRPELDDVPGWGCVVAMGPAVDELGPVDVSETDVLYVPPAEPSSDDAPTAGPHPSTVANTTTGFRPTIVM